MLFLKPIPFDEALSSAKAKLVLGTKLTDKQIAALGPKLRRRALVLAKQENARFAAQVKRVVEAILSGKESEAGAKQMLREWLDSTGYDPEKPGTIEDLGSNARLNLIVRTETQMHQSYAEWKDGQRESVLQMWPAQELYRAEDRMEPRDWPERWQEAGGQFFAGASDYPEGRMIALKSDPIWKAISRFDQPWPPFDFNSGMSVRDVDRDEALELGLLDEGDLVVATGDEMDDELPFPDDLPDELERELRRELANERMAINTAFDERSHPRDRSGKFARVDTLISNHKSSDLKEVRRRKETWIENGRPVDEAHALVNEYYRAEKYSSLGPDVLLVTAPSTTGKNLLPVVLANRIASDTGATVFRIPVATNAARSESKHKTGYEAKARDPVLLVPHPEALAALRAAAAGKRVVVVDDVINSGESISAIRNLLEAHGVRVHADAGLVGADKRKVTPRDVERLAERLHGSSGGSYSLDNVRAMVEARFHGHYKQLLNYFERAAAGSSVKARVLLESIVAHHSGGVHPTADGKSGTAPARVAA